MTDATSIVPTQVLSGVLSDPTAMLFGLEEFSVLRVDRCGPRAVKVIIEQIARDGPCPDCGVLSAVVKDRPLTRIKDLPASGQAVELWWRKRRFRCVEDRCPRRSFTQTATAVRPRSRLTERLRDKLASAIAGSNRSVADVAAEYGVSWPTAHKALVVAAAHWLPEPEPTAVLGIDETRFRSVRWLLDGVTWRRSDPWMTSFVDCTPGHAGPLLGLAPGRTGGCVREWLGEQSDAFRRRIEIVVIDLSAPYASGIRAALPRVKIAVDKWHHRSSGTGSGDASTLRPDQGGSGRLGGQGTPSPPPPRARAVEDPVAAGRLLRGRDRRPPARSDPTCRHRPELVASHSHRARQRCRQRPNRRVQPDHQTSQENRLRLPQHDQLPAAYPHPHRGHPTAKISSIDGPHPAQVRRTE